MAEENSSSDKETVIVTDSNKSNGTAVIVGLAALILLVMAVFLFVGNPFSSSDTTNVDINAPAPTSGGGSQQ